MEWEGPEADADARAGGQLLRGAGDEAAATGARDAMPALTGSVASRMERLRRQAEHERAFAAAHMSWSEWEVRGVRAAVEERIAELLALAASEDRAGDDAAAEAAVEAREVVARAQRWAGSALGTAWAALDTAIAGTVGAALAAASAPLPAPALAPPGAEPVATAPASTAY